MPTPRLVLCSLLLGAPLLSHAQSAKPTPYKFYGSLAAYTSAYNKFTRYSGRFTLPIQATLGYQIHPRLAVQAGIAYSSYSNLYTGYTYYNASSQNYRPASGKYIIRYASVSLLTRYTLTRKLEHRMQFDVLGGLTLEHAGSRDAGNQLDSLQNTTISTPYDYRYSDNTVLATAGISTRYCFSQRLELVYDLATNYDFRSSRQYATSGFTGSTALGLRYRFGQ
jgi:hypothetical protein